MQSTWIEIIFTSYSRAGMHDISANMFVFNVMQCYRESASISL